MATNTKASSKAAIDKVIAQLKRLRRNCRLNGLSCRELRDYGRR